MNKKNYGTDRKTDSGISHDQSEINQILIDYMPYPCIMTEQVTGVIIACNKTAGSMGAVIGHTCRKSVTLTGGQCLWCRALMYYDKSDTGPLEIDDKGNVWEVYRIPVLPENVLYIYYFIDITERKLAELRLRMQEERFRVLIEHSNDAITLLDEDGTILYDTPSILHVLGYNPDDRIGKKIFDFVPPENRENMIEGYKRFVSTLPGTTVHSSLRFIHKNGSIRHIEGIQTNLLHEPSVSAIVVNYRDVTEKKHAEESLQSTHAKLAATLDALPDLLFEVDTDGRIYDFRAPSIEMLYIRPEQFLDRRISDILPEKTARTIEKAIAEAVSTGRHTGAVYSLEMPSGIRWFELSIALRTDAEKTAPRLIALSRDITDRKQMENALVRRERELELLTSRLMKVREEERVRIARNIHDDIGHAIMAVKMDIFLLEKQLLAGKSAEGSLSYITLKLDNVIESVQKISLDIRPPVLYDLGLVDAIIFYAHRFTENSGIRCRTEIASDIPVISGDRAIAMYRIIQEACTNVYRHADATEIVIRMMIDGDWCVSTIQDNGTGISQASIDDINSIGILGMRERAFAFGGTLSINRMEVKGTIVTLRIPLAGIGE